MIPRPEILIAVDIEARELEPELTALLDRISPTDCRRRAECCRLLPHMSLMEAAYAINGLIALEKSTQKRAWLKLTEYFLVNAARITACPFLDQGGCLIYNRRAFGCRAYGLWSPNAYATKQKDAQQAQAVVAQAWAGLGIQLPKSVTSHSLPYCNQVTPQDGLAITDQDLNAIERDIRALDRRLAPHSKRFAAEFQNDLSFAIVVGQMGLQPALRAKVAVTRELTTTGKSLTLDRLLDPFV